VKPDAAQLKNVTVGYELTTALLAVVSCTLDTVTDSNHQGYVMGSLNSFHVLVASSVTEVSELPSVSYSLTDTPSVTGKNGPLVAQL